MSTSIESGTKEFARAKLLKIPVAVWLRLILDLRHRGCGERESGAFLLGTRGARRVDVVKTYACYDDLYPRALDAGYVQMDGSGFGKLWEVCRERKLQVLSDVHTHPGPDSRQSGIDRENAMMPRAGHIAIILPSYARYWGWRFRGASLYEYLGDGKWRDWSGDDRRERVRFRWSL